MSKTQNSFPEILLQFKDQQQRIFPIDGHSQCLFSVENENDKNIIFEQFQLIDFVDLIKTKLEIFKNDISLEIPSLDLVFGEDSEVLKELTLSNVYNFHRAVEIDEPLTVVIIEKNGCLNEHLFRLIELSGDIPGDGTFYNALREIYHENEELDDEENFETSNLNGIEEKRNEEFVIGSSSEISGATENTLMIENAENTIGPDLGNFNAGENIYIGVQTVGIAVDKVDGPDNGLHAARLESNIVENGNENKDGNIESNLILYSSDDESVSSKLNYASNDPFENLELYSSDEEYTTDNIENTDGILTKESNVELLQRRKHEAASSLSSGRKKVKV